jgi:hypothetical protein
MVLLNLLGFAALRDVVMSKLKRVLHPVDFFTHLLHFPSAGPAVTRDSSPVSVVDLNVTRGPVTNNPGAGMRPAELDRDGCTVYEPDFVQEMVMDLPRRNIIET